MTAKLIQNQQQKMRHLPIHFILMLYSYRMRVVDELLRVEPLYSMLNDYSQCLYFDYPWLKASYKFMMELYILQKTYGD